jgi:hypothetical protein
LWQGLQRHGLSLASGVMAAKSRNGGNKGSAGEDGGGVQGGALYSRAFDMQFCWANIPQIVMLVQ